MKNPLLIPTTVCLSASLAASLIASCTIGESGEPVEQLEQLSATVVEPASDGGEEEATLSAAGALALSAEGAQDFTVSVGEVTVAVHSPAGTDLSAWDGQEVSLSVMTWHWPDWPRSVALSDAQGPAWIADVGLDASEVNALLGAEVVSFGEEVAAGQDETWDWSYRTLKLQTDDGEVTLLPGDVEAVTIGGVAWQVTAVAAYQRDARPSAELPGCPVVEDLLSYEMLRLDAPKESDFLVRDEAQQAAGIGCLAE